MKFSNKNVVLALSLASLAGAFGSACNAPAANGTTANSATVSTQNSAVGSNQISTNGSAASSNPNAAASPNAFVETKEPEQYQATVLLKLESSGEQNNMNFPAIKADVARSGNDRRMEFKLPSGETVVYLDRAGRQLIISPQKKQYGELDKESTGVDVRRLLMPEQIVSQLKNVKNLERVADDTVDGRSAVKYRFAATTDTKSAAGQVKSESFILVDKETGLPLRSYTNLGAQNNVQGVNSLNFVTEINNIKTDVDAKMFAEPTDFQKVAPEQIRGQLDGFLRMATMLFGQMMKSNQPANNFSPANTATPQN